MYKHSEETKEKIRLSNLGKHNFTHTAETIQKISEAGKRRRGKTSPFKGLSYEEIGRGPSSLKGIPRPLKVREAIGRARKERYLKDGIIREPKRDSVVLRNFNSQVKKRDNYTCQNCRITQKQIKKVGNQTKDYLHVHHIKPWKPYPELRFDATNGITLCWTCHLKAENKEISIPDKMPEIKKKDVWNKGKKTGISYERSSEQLLELKLRNLLYKALDAVQYKGGRPKGLPAWNKGKTNLEIYGEEKATQLSTIAAENARRTKNRLGTGKQNLNNRGPVTHV